MPTANPTPLSQRHRNATDLSQLFVVEPNDFATAVPEPVAYAQQATAAQAQTNSAQLIPSYENLFRDLVNLLRRPSVSPEDAGCQEELFQILKAYGWYALRANKEDVTNTHYFYVPQNVREQLLQYRGAETAHLPVRCLDKVVLPGTSEFKKFTIRGGEGDVVAPLLDGEKFFALYDNCQSLADCPSIEDDHALDVFFLPEVAQVCLAGHCDVVPPGEGWTSPAFEPTLRLEPGNPINFGSYQNLAFTADKAENAQECSQTSLQGVHPDAQEQAELLAAWEQVVQGTSQLHLDGVGNEHGNPSLLPLQYTNTKHWPEFWRQLSGFDLFARGACDMKQGTLTAGYAAVLATLITGLNPLSATAQPTNSQPTNSQPTNSQPTNSQPKIVFALTSTSDEEAVSEWGTKWVVEVFEKRGITLDYCLVAEPSSVRSTGDQIRIGRRGSSTFEIRVCGVQGHVAYPHKVTNPIHLAAPLLAKLAAWQIDQGNEEFPPSSLQIVQVAAGDGTANLVPGELKIKFNIRFNSEQTHDKLVAQVEKFIAECNEVDDPRGASATETNTYNTKLELGKNTFLKATCSGDAFVTNGKHPFVQLAQAAVKANTSVFGLEGESRNQANFTGVHEHVLADQAISDQRKTELDQFDRTPRLDTGGGTSDGRFLAKISKAIFELGTVSHTLHKVDEKVQIAEVIQLYNIYSDLLVRLYHYERLLQNQGQGQNQNLTQNQSQSEISSQDQSTHTKTKESN